MCGFRRVMVWLVVLVVLSVSSVAFAAGYVTISPSLTVQTVSAATSVQTWPVIIYVPPGQQVIVSLDQLEPVTAPGTGQNAFSPNGANPDWHWIVGHNGPLGSGVYHWRVEATRFRPGVSYNGVVLTTPPPSGSGIHVVDQLVAVWIITAPGHTPLTASAPQMSWTATSNGRMWVLTLTAHNPGSSIYPVTARLDLYRGSHWLGERTNLRWPALLPNSTATLQVTLPFTSFAERVRWQWYWGQSPTPGALWRTLPAGTPLALGQTSTSSHVIPASFVQRQLAWFVSHTQPAEAWWLLVAIALGIGAEYYRRRRQRRRS